MRTLINATATLVILLAIGIFSYGVYSFGYSVGNSDMKISCLDILRGQVETEANLLKSNSEIELNESQTLLNTAETLKILPKPEPGPTPAPHKESQSF